MRAALAASVLCLSLTGVVATLAPAPAGAVVLSTPEAQFLAKMNDLRTSKGLGTLTIDDQLTQVARNWTAHMAQQGAISHNPNLGTDVTENWQKLGENVGEGPNVDSLWNAFINSPHHYANLVDPTFSLVGIGVVVAPDGTMYTTHDFEEPASSPAPPPPPPAPRAPPPPAQPSAPPVHPAATTASGPATGGSGPGAPATTSTTVPTGASPTASGAATDGSGHRVIVVLKELQSLDGTGT